VNLLARSLRAVALGVVLLLGFAAASIAWVVNTHTGTVWIAGMLGRALDGRLSFEHLEGTLAGPLALQGLRYSDPDNGLDVSVERATTDVELLALLRGLVHVRDARIGGVHVVLGEPRSPTPPEGASQPFSLEPPIDIVVDSFVLEDATIDRAGEPVLAVRRATLVAGWTDAGVAMDRLDVVSPQGELHFAGRVSHPQQYVGEGRGRFQWRVGELSYAGELEARTEAARAQLALRLAAPFHAQLDASVEQTRDLPWRFSLEVPRFDPRDGLMPESALQALAATLHGEGSRAEGLVTGSVELDELPIRIDPLRFVRRGDRIDLDPLTLRVGEGDGALHARGSLSTAEPPARAELDIRWEALELPARLAGQELHTQGRMRFSGSADAYSSNGRLAIGPPGKPVDVAFDVQGTPQAVTIERLALLQAHGELRAEGQVDIQPGLGWRVQAQARDFDPGAIAAGWPGRVSFGLITAGRMAEGGPEGKLELQNLRGRLRDRELAGRADLEFTARPSLQGTLALRSGNSRIDVRGQGGDELQATADLDVRSLSDWMPDAEGSLDARIAARGRWPRLSITARASGHALRLAELRADTLAFELDLLDPKQPSGSARIELAQVAAAGFEFASVRAQASGREQAHTLELAAAGTRLSGELRVEGARNEGGWSGTIQELRVETPNVPALALQAPAKVALSAGSATLQQACLAGGDMRVCTALDREPDGALEVSYALAGVQLALANAFAPDLPVTASGTLEGEGEIRRLADGELHGRARIELPGGRLAPVDTPDQALIEYANVRLNGELSGREARIVLGARLNDEGHLDGDVVLSGIGELDTSVRGSVSAAIPSLAPLGLFVPQLAEVGGRADLRASVNGAIAAPEIGGELLASELTAQIPELGLKLTEGRLRAAPLADGGIELEGEVRSGKGKVALAGSMTRDGEVRASVTGEDFLAADIPAARVIAAPDLRFTRDAQRMSLTGEVRVPTADVDLRKLPAGGPQQASQDVVVVDAPAAEEEQAGPPLYADIAIVLGEEVKLAGFGLEATVKGRLAVKEAPGEPTTGSGDVNVAGTYRAYGQDLTIQRGQLLFAGTPLDNPGVSIVATRKVEGVTAGLRVQGTARTPQLSVFSEPAMSQAEALSYLVTGRPLDSIGSSEGEGDALQSAARSLGAAGGGLLAKSIGGRLGVDQAGIEKNEMIGGAAFTVGQYLSPRLYLSYGVGLFEPGEVVSLRYRLSNDLSLQTARGSNETRAGIEYRIEK